MLTWCINQPEFHPSDRVVSLVFHLPEISPGTAGTIVAPHVGSLYAVQLPSGELHQWFDRSELQPLNDRDKYSEELLPGTYATIVLTEGHHGHFAAGTTVKIVKTIGRVVYYDLMIDGHGYHRWLAEFEIAPYSVVSGM